MAEPTTTRAEEPKPTNTVDPDDTNGSTTMDESILEKHQDESDSATETPAAQPDTYFIEGIKLFIVMSGLIVLMFLVMLDISILGTVNKPNSQLNPDKQLLTCLPHRLFHKSLVIFTVWKMSVGTWARTSLPVQRCNPSQANSTPISAPR